MKKLLLLLAAGAIAGAANAQTSVVFTEKSTANGILPQGMTTEKLAKDYETRRNARLQDNQRAMNEAVASKGSKTARRTYNYVDLLYSQTPTIVDNVGASYMWNSYNGLANYSSGYDTINTVSFGQLIQPYYNKWNSVFAFPGTPTLAKDAAYRLDTVKLYGLYLRNAAKTNVVDTMRMSFYYGNGAATSNVVFDYRLPANSTTATNYGVDTLKFAYTNYDSAKTRAKQGTGGAAIITKDVPMTFVYNDTTEQGLEIIRVPVGLNVPAGNIVGMTYSFKTGDATFTPYDTVLLAGASNTVVPKYSMFRPRVFEQNASAYPTYYADSNYNNGQLQLYPLNGSSRYFAMYFLTAASSGEFSDVDFVISSSEFDNNLLSVGNNANLINSVNAFPNPAAGSVTIPVVLNAAAEVTVSITNVMGQVIRTQALGRVEAGATASAVFSTAELANGVYLYSVDANGQRATRRFTVAH